MSQTYANDITPDPLGTDDGTLRDALIELDNLRRQEQRRRRESDQLVRALGILTENTKNSEPSTAISSLICEALDAAALLVFSLDNDEPIPQFGHPEALADHDWQASSFLPDLLAKPSRAIVNLALVPSWQALPGSLQALGQSALSTRFVNAHGTYGILCLGRTSNAFDKAQEKLFNRLSQVLYQALVRLQDQKDRERLERELLQAQKLEALGTLAGGIAHEINTPIQYISDNLHFLQETTETLLEDLSPHLAKLATLPESLSDDFQYARDEVPNACADALKGVGQVGKIVSSMRTFAHPGTREFTSANVNEGLESAIIVCKSKWKAVATMDLQLDQNLPLIDCLPSELNQVWLNFLMNAVHAIEDKDMQQGQKRAEIRVRSGLVADQTECSDAIFVEVEDSGIGMSEDIVARVFDPFFTTKVVGRGTGQGLSLVYDIIQTKHRGKLSVRSEPGIGTTFRVELPMSQSVAPTAPMATDLVLS